MMTTAPIHQPHDGVPSSDPFDADVVIVGAGPVGTLLGILLGRQGHRATVVEKWSSPYVQPRAVTFDHEVARILAILGIDSETDPAIEHHDEVYYWKNADRQNLLEVDWGSTAASGWRTRYWFYQPELEARLREIADATDGVEIRWGWTATELNQDADGVTLIGQLRSAGAAPADTETIRARYIVGADGARSFVRESLGLGFEDHGYFFDWLILDMKPTEHIDVGPVHWQLCDPARPTTIVPGGPGRRRWEFMALPGEDLTELASTETAWNLLKPWNVTPDNAELERSAVYRFQARCLDTWHHGRGLIAGDAAHLMPPFAGEGMCAGVRDALALAWRFDHILSGVAGEELLDTYGPERREHVRRYIDFSMELGRIICIDDPAEAAARDERMIAELAASDGTPVDTDLGSLGPGLWIEDCPHSGELSVQGIVESAGREGRFDEVVGRGWMVLGLDTDPLEPLSRDIISRLTALGGHGVRLRPRGHSGSARSTGEAVLEAVDVDGTYEDWFRSIDANYVVLRPDFYVAAAAGSGPELHAAVTELFGRLGSPDTETIRDDREPQRATQ